MASPFWVNCSLWAWKFRWENVNEYKFKTHVKPFTHMHKNSEKALEIFRNGGTLMPAAAAIIHTDCKSTMTICVTFKTESWQRRRIGPRNGYISRRKMVPALVLSLHPSTHVWGEHTPHIMAPGWIRTGNQLWGNSNHHTTVQPKLVLMSALWLFHQQCAGASFYTTWDPPPGVSCSTSSTATVYQPSRSSLTDSKYPAV